MDVIEFMKERKYKYLFGPVPSRRLGQSLGVDLVPRKVCTLDCVYCESGQTTKKTVERKEYIRYDDITRELDDWFATNSDPDYLTFSGAGEPTLNSRIGDIIQHIKNRKPHLQVALITNGTLLSDPGLREELMDVDLLLPSLDAATQEVFEKINRPAGGLTSEEYADGLVAFSREFTGEMWLEVFVLPRINDHEQEIRAIREVILKIGPDRIQVNTLDRPGTEENLVAATAEELEYFVKMLDMDHVEIIASPGENRKERHANADIREAILSTISRRPCTAVDLGQSLGLPEDEINRYLEMLKAENSVIPVRQERGLFYRLKN